MELSYKAIFEYAEDGINITFPDIPEAITCAFSKQEGIKMAKEALTLVLHKKSLNDIPKPSIVEVIANRKEVINITIFMDVEDGLLYGENVIEFD